MQRALVIGRAVATAKHPSLEGQRVLLTQPITETGKPDGEPLLVVDDQGGSAGEIVVISSDGKYARQLLGREDTPIRYTAIALEDPLS